MATCLPRPKLFGSTISSTPLLFLCFIAIFCCVTFLVGNLLFTPVFVSGESSPGFKIDEFSDPGRVPRSLIRLDNDDDIGMESYNNPTVLEGGQENGGKSGDGYETLRQLSLASTQSFIRRRLFNTSVALTVPLFSFTLPQRAAEGSTVDLANQAIFGLFALLVVILVFAVPVVFTGVRPFDVEGRSNDVNLKEDVLKNLMRSEHVLNLMGAEMKNKIGLNQDICLQKSICDAHRNPKKFGLLGLPFQLFFPPPSPEKEKSRSASIYQMAALTGKRKKTECWSKYNCFFDFLDLAVYFLDWYNPKTPATETILEEDNPNNDHEFRFI